MSQQSVFPAMPGQKIYPPSPRRRRRLRVMVFVIVLLALLSGVGYLSSSVFSKTSILPQQSFLVSDTPTLVINGPVGSVKIHRGNYNSIVINAAEHSGLFSSPNTADVTVAPEPGSNSFAVLTEDGGSIFDHKTVDLDITLPATSNIRAVIPVGSLDINGISGQMNLDMYAGTLHVENGIIEGQSTFKNDAGEITFNGALASNGSYDFEDNTGAITLTLPSNSSFVTPLTLYSLVSWRLAPPR